jgi:RecA-family ATPase
VPSARLRDFALTSEGALRVYSTDELMRMHPPQWQVGGLIPENSFGVLYGPSGCGKSFVAIGLALSVASGLPWASRPTTKGFVLYVSAEGTAGLGQRVKAWMLDATLDSSDVDIAWLPEAISIHSDSTHIDTLFERFEEMGRAPSLVIIDTLARCFDGDENHTEDMGNFIRGVDKIRHGYGCSVLAVHHTNAAAERERGNGALRSASDTMVRMMPGILGSKAGSQLRAAQDTFTILTDKQKDAEAGPIGIGRLRSIDATTSCVADIEWLDPSETPGL